MHSHPFGRGLGRHLLGHLSEQFGERFARHAIGRHSRGGGRGFWSGFGDADGGDGTDGFDEGGWRRGRKFSADDLQLLLLSLLEEQPSHGYELIKALETRTSGFYKPSPGVIYPALTYLEEVGYATVDSEGNKKRYHLAQPGRDHLEANRERLALMLGKLRHVARKMEWMRRAMAGEAQVEPEAGGWLPEYVAARQGLKRALVLRGEASPDEQRRIAAILQRATAEIEAPGKA
ncbi:PadR family transcriptional regulator [Cupriavidus sp. USMAHM13]|uniref:PadR family transcriptional regulator n=1 Tax=Cupriavidus malaysiensis TaxID=367825 RepID=A0ABN4TVD9_9BURK|nr:MULTISPECIES: PadR family transcriptional regulator [Cupriavidus]AOZ02978.1 PadR family transcriptional regulator [Cupriavidus sp. USMAHM13]AOZ09650.1 PadR family transcriptional regulator [Cupriavidus malaysiensis]